jgi:glutaconate CoA-transferase subunit A
MYVTGVVEAPRGAHFTSCDPDYGRDEAFQAHYAGAARDEESWQAFSERFLSGDEGAYQDAVASFHQERTESEAKP